MEAWIIQTITNVGLFFAAFLLSNMLTKGFVFRYLRVWASRGSLLMIKIHTPMDHYFKIGWVEEGFLMFNDKTTRGGVNQAKARKKAKRLTLSTKAVYRCLGVAMVDVDEEKNCLILPDMSLISGYDANKINNLFMRALSEPRKQANQKMILWAVLLAGASVLVSVGVIYNIVMIQDTLKVVLTAIEEGNAGTLIPAVIGINAKRFLKW